MTSGTDIASADMSVQSLVAAHSAVAQLQAAAGEVHQALATTRHMRITSQTVASLHVISMYCESIGVLLKEIAEGAGIKL
jgi:hypothetical protein